MPNTAGGLDLDPVTLGEVWRGLGAMQRTLDVVAADVSEMRTTGAASTVELSHLAARVTALESAQRWIVRTVGALILAGVMAGVIVAPSL